MGFGLSIVEGQTLHGLLEEASGDIIVKLDASGFIIHASANIAQLGEDLSAQLLMPHISDLSEPEHSDLVAAHAEDVLTKGAQASSVEFPVIVYEDTDGCLPAASRRWYSLSLRPLFRNEGAENGDRHALHSCSDDVVGAVGLLRSVQHLRLLEGELHSRAVTDPLTGLSNRLAFCAHMRRQLAAGSSNVVVVFAVDRMRAMMLQYGQRTADEIQWGFAKFLEAMIQPGYELAQLDNERFAVMVPDIALLDARAWAQEVLATFSQITITSSPRSPKLSASAGIASLEGTVDWTLRQAELALVIARAGGGSQAGQCDYQAKPFERIAAV